MKKVESLQAFRAIAFLFVFLSHTELCPTGSIGVSMFLVLSGFLMAFSTYRKPMMGPVTFRSSVRFAVAKISRLYPLHMITLGMMLAYTVLLLWKDGFPAASVQKTILSLPLNALLLQTWVPDEAVYFTFNKVSWYLSVCLFIYLIFPYFFNKLRSYTIPRLWFAGFMIVAVQCVSAFAAQMALPEPIRPQLIKWITYICPLFRSGDFFLGTILGLLCIKYDVQPEETAKRSFRYSVLECLCLLLCCVTIIWRQMAPLCMRYGIIYLPVSLLGVWLFYKQRGYLVRGLTNKVLIRIGNVSAYAFLIHQMTIHLMKFLVKDIWLLSIVSLAFTIVFSVVYGKLEKYILVVLIAYLMGTSSMSYYLAKLNA